MADDAFDYSLAEYLDDSYGGLTGAETGKAVIVATVLELGEVEMHPTVLLGEIRAVRV